MQRQQGRRHDRFRAAILGGGLALSMVLAGCAFIDPAPDPATDSGPSDAEDGAYLPVQDTWIYEQIRTVSAEGDIIDITESVLSALTTDHDEAVEIHPGAIFTPLESGGTAIVTGSGNTRDDLEVVAGITEVGGSAALQVIATPTGDRSVDPGDRVRLDLPLDLAPNSPLMIDFVFGQGLPEAGEEPADDGVALLASRMGSGQFQWLGVETDGERLPGLQTVFGVFDPRDDVIEPVLSRDEGHRGDALWRGDAPVVMNTDFGGGAHIPAKARPVLEPVQDLAGCDKIPLRCIGVFFNDMQRGFSDALDDIFGRNMPPRQDPPRKEPPPCLGSCGSGVGDPHMRTFDGLPYDMQLVGEFVMAASEDVEVQMRTAPWGHSTYVSIITAVAVRVGDHHVNVFLGEGQPILVDGEEITDVAHVVSLGDSGTVEVQGQDVLIEAGSGVSVDVRGLNDRFLSVFVDSGEVTDWVGLLGSPDGDQANDLTARDGTTVPNGTPVEELYSDFADGWRLSDAESHFVYSEGEDTGSFTDPDFPYAHVTIDSLPADRRAIAEAVCREAGITEETLLEWCILDYGFTGDASFVEDLRVEFVTAHPELAAAASAGHSPTAGTASAGEPLPFDDGWGVFLPNLTGTVHPAVLDGRGNILVRGDTPAGGSALFSLDGETTAVNWSIESEGEVCAAVTESDRLVALIGAGGKHTVQILDPATGETLSTTPTVLQGCDHAEASGETVFLSHGTGIFGFDADHEVIAFESGMPGIVSSAVVAGDGRAWAVGMFDGAPHAVEFLLPSGDVDLTALPAVEVLGNIEATPTGFIATYIDEGGEHGLMRFNPLDADMSGGHPTPLPNLFDGDEAGEDPTSELSTDGEVVAGYMDDSTIGVLDVVTGEPLRLIRPSGEPSESRALHVDDGRVLAAPSGGDSWLEIFDAHSGELLHGLGTAGVQGAWVGDATQIGPVTPAGGVVAQTPLPGGIAVVVLTPQG